MASKKAKTEKKVILSAEDILLRGRDWERMKKAAEEMDRLAAEIAKRGKPKGWNSTRELRKLRYGKY